MYSSIDFSLSPGPKPFPEMRRFRRLPLVLFGRCRLFGLTESPCHTKDISVGGAAIIAPVSANAGALASISLDGLGDLRGEIVRIFPGGFAIEFDLDGKARGALSRRLETLASKTTGAHPHEFMQR